MEYSRTGRRGGFTLIELLVVVAIITLLIAVLMPGLRQARQAASRVACASNLRQISVTVRMYTSEFNEWLPASTTSNVNPDVRWQPVLANMIGQNFVWNSTSQPKVYRCPAQAYPSDFYYPKTYLVSYAMHQMTSNPDPQSHWNASFTFRYTWMKLGWVNNSTFWLLGDVQGFYPWTFNNDWTSMGAFRHGGKRPNSNDAIINLTYLDSHVESVKFADFVWLTPQNAQMLQR